MQQQLSSMYQYMQAHISHGSWQYSTRPHTCYISKIPAVIIINVVPFVQIKQDGQSVKLV